MNKIANILRPLMPPFVLTLKRKLFGSKSNTNHRGLIPDYGIIGSFSQQGEDLVIDQLLKNKESGFYVDVGAYDPHQFSNTKRFYIKSWRGINIEPQPNCFEKFAGERPRDINLNHGVHVYEGELTFYELTSPTLSTFDRDQAELSAKKFKCRIENEYKIKVLPLRQILRDNLRPGQEIDFMSIDTEGNEMNVLRGNDWDKFRPKLVLIEYGSNTFAIDDFLRNINYVLVYKNSINGLYLNLESLNEKLKN